MYQEKIREYFKAHEQEFLEDLKQLVAINSEKMEAQPGKPYGEGPAQAIGCMMELGKKYGFCTNNMDNYVGCVSFQEGQRELEILAHMDVVPAGEGWTKTSPFETYVEDGKVYGRGTADDKGPALAALYAMRAIRELGIPVEKNVRLVVGGDEECGSSDMEYYFSKEEPAPMTFSPDAEFPIINIEKGRFGGTVSAEYEDGEAGAHIVKVEGGVKGNMVPGHADAVVAGMQALDVAAVMEDAKKKYQVQVTLEEKENLHIHVEGIQGHAADPGVCNNAITALLAILSELPLDDCDLTKKVEGLHELFPHGDWKGQACGLAMEDEESGQLTISLNILKVENGALRAQFDARVPICATEEKLSILDKKCRQADLHLESSLVAPHYVPSDSPFVQTLLKCYEQYTGQKGYPMAIGGGTYVHEIENGVAFGCSMPGTDNKMHGADEFAVIEELMLSGQIFTQAIADLCGR